MSILNCLLHTFSIKYSGLSYKMWIKICNLHGVFESLEFGGSTIYPQAGISFQPEIGSGQNNHDSIILHRGCPVAYGNKWIANKWIKWLSNYRDFPCLINHKQNSDYRHHISESSRHHLIK